MHTISPLPQEQPCSASARQVHFFKFEGRKYKLVKRESGRDAPWYTEFALRGQRYHRSLETNQAAAAQARAIERIIKPDKSGDQAALQAAKVKRASSTLAELFAAYDRCALIAGSTKENNKGALLLLFKWATGAPVDPARVTLERLTPDLVRSAQAGMVRAYAETGDGERAARELALRSSKSLYNQAKSLFARRTDLVAQYRAAGLHIPECALEFAAVRVQGKMA